MAAKKLLIYWDKEGHTSIVKGLQLVELYNAEVGIKAKVKWPLLATVIDVRSKVKKKRKQVEYLRKHPLTEEAIMPREEERRGNIK